MAFRATIPDFQISNASYVGARVFFFEADENGNLTTTLAPLYKAPTGTQTVLNPQTLDAFGKFAAPVYIDRPVIGQVIGATVGTHLTGVIAPRGRWQGDWVTGTRYFTQDFIQDPVSKNILAAADDHVSGASIADDLNAGKLEVVVDFSAFDITAFTALAQEAAGIAVAAKEDAESARDKAEKWAEEDVDVEVESGRFSAKHHAAKAEDWAAAAQAAAEFEVASQAQAESEAAISELNNTALMTARRTAQMIEVRAQRRKTMARVAITGTTLTISEEDHAGKYLVFTNALQCVVTIPPGLPANMAFQCRANGAAGVAFTGGDGVTLEVEGPELAVHKGCTWVHAGSNVWEGTGGLG